MSLSINLLEQAELLALKEPRRPKEASLRRSISTAYYALFHFLIEEATGLLLGKGPKSEALRLMLGRAAVHGTMKSACLEVGKSTMAAPFQAIYPGLGSTGSMELSIVAKAFVELQERRHEADYNLSASIQKADATSCVAMAKNAMQSWRTLKTLNEQKALFFAILLINFGNLSNRK